MELLIDNANTAKIRELVAIYPIDGVTTNPTILAASGRPPFAVLKEIRSILGPDGQIHAQVVSREAEGMVKEARAIVEALGPNTYVKIPAVPEGFKAMKQLKKDGIPFTATAIYTPMQAYLAAKAGASYAAPYVNRIDNMGFDGIHVVKEIQDIFDKNQLPCKILGASFKNSQQVLELAKYGVGAATAAPDVIESFVKNAAIDAAVEAFISDFEGLVGPSKTMLECVQEN